MATLPKVANKDKVDLSSASIAQIAQQIQRTIKSNVAPLGAVRSVVTSVAKEQTKDLLDKTKSHSSTVGKTHDKIDAIVEGQKKLLAAMTRMGKNTTKPVIGKATVHSSRKPAAKKSPISPMMLKALWDKLEDGKTIASKNSPLQGLVDNLRKSGALKTKTEFNSFLTDYYQVQARSGDFDKLTKKYTPKEIKTPVSPPATPTPNVTAVPPKPIPVPRSDIDRTPEEMQAYRDATNAQLAATPQFNEGWLKLHEQEEKANATKTKAAIKHKVPEIGDQPAPKKMTREETKQSLKDYLADIAEERIGEVLDAVKNAGMSDEDQAKFTEPLYKVTEALNKKFKKLTGSVKSIEELEKAIVADQGMGANEVWQQVASSFFAKRDDIVQRVKELESQNVLNASNVTASEIMGEPTPAFKKTKTTNKNHIKSREELIHDEAQKIGLQRVKEQLKKQKTSKTALNRHDLEAWIRREAAHPGTIQEATVKVDHAQKALPADLTPNDPSHRRTGVIELSKAVFKAIVDADKLKEKNEKRKERWEGYKGKDYFNKIKNFDIDRSVEKIGDKIGDFFNVAIGAFLNNPLLMGALGAMLLKTFGVGGDNMVANSVDWVNKFFSSFTPPNLVVGGASGAAIGGAVGAIGGPVGWLAGAIIGATAAWLGNAIVGPEKTAWAIKEIWAIVEEAINTILGMMKALVEPVKTGKRILEKAVDAITPASTKHAQLTTDVAELEKQLATESDATKRKELSDQLATKKKALAKVQETVNLVNDMREESNKPPAARGLAGAAFTDESGMTLGAQRQSKSSGAEPSDVWSFRPPEPRIPIKPNKRVDPRVEPMSQNAPANQQAAGTAAAVMAITNANKNTTVNNINNANRATTIQMKSPAVDTAFPSGWGYAGIGIPF